MIKTIVDAICDGPISEYRSEALKHSLSNAAGSYDIEKACLLAREACVRQIFGSSAGTDGNTAHTILAHLGVRRIDLLLNFRGKASIHYHMSGLSASISQVIQIRHVDIFEKQLKPLPQFKPVEDCIVCSTCKNKLKM